MKGLKLRSVLLIMLGMSLFGCTDDDKTDVDKTGDLTDQEIISKYLNVDLSNLHNYSQVTYPVHYDQDVLAVDNTPANNQVTDMGATLGRVLFYDKMLSVNNTVACASCHKQNIGFVDENVLSEGFEGGFTGAHSMRIGNVRFYEGESMFWNKRAATLEAQATMPIQDEKEMGFDSIHGGFGALVTKLEDVEYYPILFKRVFGSGDITEEKVQMVLAQFMRSMVSINSKFDEGYTQVYNAAQPGKGIGRPFPNYTGEENEGKDLFLQPVANGGAGCAGCHNPPTFSLDPNARSNGLTMGETVIFKSPSLKNVALTGPYMHDGSIADLAGVVEHYNSGILGGPSLDPRLRVPPMPIRLNLTQTQKDALVAFMETLTDNDLIADERFSDPFKS